VTEALLDACAARTGIICVVGAGGKKTTIFRLVAAHGGRLGITSTVYTPPFRKRLGARVVSAPEHELLAAVQTEAKTHPRVAYALPSDKRARYRGVTPQLVGRIHRVTGFDATFVKGDGARLRWIKAPGPDEPLVPVETTTLLPVVSVRTIGQPLSSEVAHRWQLVGQVTGLRAGENITAAHLARLLSSEHGALKNAGTARVIPVINMVETRDQLRLARAAAEQALDLSQHISHVVLAVMERDNPIVEVVDR